MSDPTEEQLRSAVEAARERLHERAGRLGDSIRDSLASADPISALTGVSLKGAGGIVTAVAAGVLLGAVGPEAARAVSRRESRIDRDDSSPARDSQRSLREGSLASVVAAELIPVVVPIVLPMILEAFTKPPRPKDEPAEDAGKGAAASAEVISRATDRTEPRS